MDLVKVKLDKDIARKHFEGISNALREYVSVIDKKEKKPRAVYVFYCGMVKKYWLQDNNKTSNPYATSMPKCGKIVDDKKKENDEHEGHGGHK